jgi:hypothetical protein
MSEFLYHGSTNEIKDINLNLSNPKRDFGKAFYLSKNLEQAIVFSKLKAKRVSQNFGIVNIYSFSQFDSVNCFLFDKPNFEWLDFILFNRGFISKVSKNYNYDIIEGPIANDQVGVTLNLLTSYAFGDPSSIEAKEFAIKQLLTQKLSNQIVFKTNKAIKLLKFERSEKYEI